MKNLPFVRVTHSVMVASLLTLPTFRCLAQNVSSDPPYSILDRGPFYRVLQRNVSVTNSVTGEVTQQVQSYTDLEDGMNYLSSGQWVEAQDVIELTPTGAQAIHGQMTGRLQQRHHHRRCHPPRYRYRVIPIASARSAGGNSPRSPFAMVNL